MSVLLYCFGMCFFVFKRFVNRSLSLYLTTSVNKKKAKPTFVIGSNTVVVNSHNIYIGDNSYVNGGYLIAGKTSKIIIGDNCLISDNVYLRADTHVFSVNHIDINKQGNSEADIVIGNNVWIGNRVQIMCGITIGDGAIVGAGAIVVKNVPAMSVVAGVPAKLIRKR